VGDLWKGLPGRLTKRQEYNRFMDLRNIGCEGRKLVEMVQDRV
jgi:hypothetical protein